MQLREYLKRYTLPGERAAFALRVGSNVGHLNNVIYGTRRPSAALARQIAIATAREVAEWDLRPDDWHLIWPELQADPKAPQVVAQVEAQSDAAA